MILKYSQFNESIEFKPNNRTKKSYSSKFIKGDHQFYNITSDGSDVGDIEFGIVDDDTFEIISIYINGPYRNNNYGDKAIKKVSEITGCKNVILRSASTSRKYWIYKGFELMDGYDDYFKKELI